MIIPAYKKDFEVEHNLQYNLYLRIGSTDKSCVKEVFKDYQKMQLENKIVMDLGGCFGAFCRFALKQKAVHIHTYEPEPKNIPLLEKNLLLDGAKKVTIYQKAVIKENTPTVKLYRGGRRGHSMESASILEIRGRESITVEACSFEKELERIKPAAIKMDVEGGEYSLLEIQLPEYVKELIVEYHFKRKALKEKCAELHNDLIMQGFKAIESPYLKDKNRHGLGLYRRN
jgi:FkbM family methyltransferase|tara:strand:+ start:1435 stop:2121 length:687 start_codon:yes stop_codon:yes gene_type:complete